MSLEQNYNSVEIEMWLDYENSILFRERTKSFAKILVEMQAQVCAQVNTNDDGKED